MKQKIIAVVFLLFIFFMGGSILLGENKSVHGVDNSDEILENCENIEDSAQNSDLVNHENEAVNKNIMKLESALNSAENKIDELNSIYVSGLEAHGEFVKLWAKTNLAIGKQVFDDAEYGYVILDYEGKLHLQDADISEEKMDEYAQNLKNLYEEERENGVEMCFIATPNKCIEGYTALPRGITLYGNKKTDDFLARLGNDEGDKNDESTEKLNDFSIPYQDMRLWLQEFVAGNNAETTPTTSDKPNTPNTANTSNIPLEDMYFKTDHHWKTETAFLAYEKLFDYLKEDMGFEKLDDFYKDRNNFKSTTYKDDFLGSIGRRVGEDIAGLDDYTFIEPDFETDYSVYNMLYDTENPMKTGDFSNAIEVESLLTDQDTSANRYASYFQWDYGNLIIKNNLVDNDCKILLVKDSYSLPLAAFLSTAFSEVHMIDMREATDINIAEYSKNHDLDAVLIIYSSGGFKDSMFDFLNEN